MRALEIASPVAAPAYVIPPKECGPKTFALLGDSLTAMHGVDLTITSLTQTGGVASATITDHGLPPGESVFVFGANQSGYNGWKTVTAVPDKDTVRFSVDSATVSPATTGSAIKVRTDKRITGSGWFQWFAGRLKGTPLLIANRGVGGDTTAQMLARVSEVINTAADTVFVLGGHNDLFWDDAADPAVSLANLKSICNTIVASGKRVILLSCEPDSDTAITTTRKKHVQQLNAALHAYALGKPGVTYIDVYSAMINPTSATGVAATNCHLTDKVHLANYGADLLGEAIYNALKNVIVTADAMPSSTIQYGNGQVFTNPLMQGTSGTLGSVGGSLATGMVAIKLTGTGTWTASSASRTVGTDGDALGSNAIVSTANTAVGDIIYFGTGDLLPALSGYSKCWSIAHVKITGAARLATVKVGLLAKIGTREHWVTALEWWNGMQTGGRDINLTLRTPEMIIPPGTTELEWYIQTASGSTGAVTLTVGRLGVYGTN